MADSETDIYKIRLNTARQYCSRKECCCADIRKKYANDDTVDVEKIILALQVDGYIDETRYVNAFVHDKLQFQQWGPAKIAYELRLKNIKPSIIQDALEQISVQQWMQVLKPLLQKKQTLIKAKSSYELKSKLFRYATAKGFAYSQIEEAIGSVDS